MLHVRVSYVSKVLERRRTTGETSARPQGGGMRPKLAGLYDAIRDHVASRPDATIAEQRAWLRETYTISASVGLVWRTLAVLGLTLKKSHSERPNRTARTWPRHVPNGARPSRS